MSEIDQDFLASLMGASSSQQMLALVTLDNLAGLPPETADAAYRCVLVHWFNADIILALTREGKPEHLGRPFDLNKTRDPNDLYRQLQSLPFIEKHSGRGHRFHDLTRHALLDYLWREENDFYLWMSELAVEYFENTLNQQLASDESGDTVDWDLLVELAYHLLIAYETAAIDQLPDWLDELVTRGLMGHCHALIQAAEEQVTAGRLDPETDVIIRYWRCHVAYLSYDYPLVESIAQELMAQSVDEVPTWIQAKVTQYWANSLRLMGQYDKAQHYYRKMLALAEDPEPDAEAQVEALLGLGMIAETQDAYQEAQTYYEQALETAVRATVVSILDDADDTDDENAELGMGLLPEAVLPTGLQLYAPESWQPLSLSTDDEKERPFNNESEELDEAEFIRLYTIDIFNEGQNVNGNEMEELLYLVPDVILARIWLYIGYLHKNRDKYDHAAACARLAGQLYEDLGDVNGVQSALELLYGLGAITGNLELMEMGVDYQHELLAIARERHNRTAELVALLSLAAAFMDRDDYKQARENYTAAWKLAQEMDDPSSIAVALDGLARLDWIEGYMETADSRFQQALKLHRQLGRREGEARLLTALASFELSRFQPIVARQHVETALTIFRELRIPNGEVQALTTLGEIYHYEDKDAEALAAYIQALALARRLDMPSDVATILDGMGLIYSLKQQHSEATDVYQEALALAKEIGQPTTQGNVLLGLGDIAVSRHEYDKAREFYYQADDIFAQLDMRPGRLNVLFGLTAIHQERGENDKAVQRAEEAVVQAEQLGDLSQVLRALRTLASCLLQKQDYARALAVLDKALALSPTDPATLAEKGDLSLEIADFETAVSLFDQALKRDESNALLWQLRGWALENTSPPRPAHAQISYEMAVSLQTDNFWAHKGIGEALRLAGDLAAAQTKYQWINDQLLAADDIDEGDYALLGWCYYRLSNYVEAIQWLQRSINREIDEISNLFDLALCTLCLGDDKKAVTLYEQGVAQISSRQKLGQRGLLHVARADLVEAITEQLVSRQSTAVQTIQDLLNQAWQNALDI